MEFNGMEEKFTAVYVMVRKEELMPEDGGSYDRPLAIQKQDCLEFLRREEGGKFTGKVQVYTSRKDLFIDIERQLVARIVVHDLNRLASNEDELAGILYELKMAGVPILTVR